VTITFVYFFLAVMLGHFVGDYLLQNQWMAINKSKPGWLGHYACSVHVLLYTLAIALFVTPPNTLPKSKWFLFLLAVAVPHWIIDRWSLANYILRFKNGFSNSDISLWDLTIAEDGKRLPFEKAITSGAWRIAFAAPVYIMNDNTLHWVCLWFTVRYFFS
jgi:hypothetical protein